MKRPLEIERIAEAERELANSSLRLKRKRLELIKHISLCKQYKKEILYFVEGLNFSYSSGALSYEEHQKKLNDSLKQRTAEEWIKYLDDSIDYCKYQLNICEQEQEPKEKFNFVLILLLFLFLGSLFLFKFQPFDIFLKPTVTGFAVIEPDFGIQSPGQYGRPDVTLSSTNWATNDTSHHEATDEVTPDGDTTYTASGSTTDPLGLSLSSITDPQSSLEHVMRFVAQAYGGGGVEKAAMDLYEGANLRASLATTNMNRTGYGQYSYTLTSTEADSIIDYSNLELRITLSNLAKGESIRVTQVELEVPDVQDNAKPQVNITYPKDINYNSSFAYQLNYSALDETGLSQCRYSLDNWATNTTITCGTNATGLSASEGSNTWGVWVNDTSNNVNTSSVTFALDTTRPNVTIVSPLEQNYTTTTVDFNTSLNEAGNNCWFSLDSAANVTMTQLNNSYFNYTKTGLTQGAHSIRFACDDAVGNMNSSSILRTFGIDSLAPSLSGERANETSILKNDYFCVNITATDASGVSSVLAEIWDTGKYTNFTMLDNGSSACDGTSANGVYGINILGNASGGWTYNKVYANDSFNNLAVYDFTDITITVNQTNIAPAITFVSLIQNTDPVEFNYSTITFYTIMKDEDGVADLDDASVSGNFSKTGEATRSNSTCKLVEDINTTAANYSCAIDMWYWDASGSWGASVRGSDAGGEITTNKTTSFTYNQLQAIAISPLNLSFDVNIGAINQLASNHPTVINNTGNYNGTININAINLLGEREQSFSITAGNFSVGLTSGGACSGTSLVNGTDTAITSSSLIRGNLSAGGGAGQEELFYCIPTIPSIASQIYSSLFGGSWTIKLVAGAILIRKRRKKLEDGRLLEAVNLILEEIGEKYSLSKGEIFESLVKRLNITKNKLGALLKDENEIPVTIFSKKLGCLEALVKYMKENLNMGYHEIAQMLNRDDRTIWGAYNKSNKKQPGRLDIKETKIVLPISIFKNRKLTILEAAVLYLKNKGLKYSEIAKMLNRDQRNIWVVYSRIKKDLKISDAF